MSYFTDDIDLFEDYAADLYDNKTECIINGKRVSYDACATGNLKEAKTYYKGYVYIGSGYIYYVNDTKNVARKKHYFFMNKTNFVKDEKVEQKLGISWVSGYGYSRHFQSVKVKVNHLYELTYGKKIKKAWFIKSTPRGFNFEDNKTYKRLFKKHIYPEENDRDQIELTIIIPQSIKLKLIEEGI